MSMKFEIRPYHPGDLPVMYRICLLTGNLGKDAGHLYDDPDLPGHFYMAPYAVFEPDLCFVLTASGTPCGYIIGTRDSMNFSKVCERDWFPVLRGRYRIPGACDDSPAAKIIRLIHEGLIVNDALNTYPAHLHIDLLPYAQGKGWGRKLMNVFTGKLRELGVPALHLGVARANGGAVKFYEAVGFHRIDEFEDGISFGMQLFS